MTPLRDETARWSHTTGEPPHRVTVFEHPRRKNVLYLRWKVQGKPKHKGLGKTLRGADGRILRDVERWAKSEAQQQLQRLLAGVPETPATSLDAALTIGEAWAKVSDPGTGKYPPPFTDHARETRTALEFAAITWGRERHWNTIRRADLRLLGRRRVDALKQKADALPDAETASRAPRAGYRGAEITVQRVLTVAQWLRDEELIDEDACIGAKDWKLELQKYWGQVHGVSHAPAPSRERYTLEQTRQLIAIAGEVDPRLDLLLALGAELRGGQVHRAMRSDLDVARGRFVVQSRGKKKGAVVELTIGQQAAVTRALTGYLQLLEAQYLAQAIDYALFPAGQMPGNRVRTPVVPADRHGAKCATMRTIIHWHYHAEARAGIPHIKGRALYGMRRALLDAATEEGISREGMKQHGGWSDNQVPDRIYREQEQVKAREEAKAVRAKIRGETP